MNHFHFWAVGLNFFASGFNLGLAFMNWSKGSNKAASLNFLSCLFSFAVAICVS